MDAAEAAVVGEGCELVVHPFTGCLVKAHSCKTMFLTPDII